MNQYKLPFFIKTVKLSPNRLIEKITFEQTGPVEGVMKIYINKKAIKKSKIKMGILKIKEL